MKKFIAMALVAGATAIYQPSAAQVSIQVNIGSQPLWGPAGYNYVDYYYLPDIESYYYVPRKQFVYLNHGNWVFSRTLPAQYRNYNLYRGYKVVINRERPYLNFKSDRVKYKKYRHWNGRQKAIRYHKDYRYKRLQQPHVNRYDKHKDGHGHRGRH